MSEVPKALRQMAEEALACNEEVLLGLRAEIQRLNEIYRREREAHAANLKEQQKCEAEIRVLRAVAQAAAHTLAQQRGEFARGEIGDLDELEDALKGWKVL